MRQRYNLPPRQDNGPSNRHHNDETIIDEGTPSPHKVGPHHKPLSTPLPFQTHHKISPSFFHLIPTSLFSVVCVLCVCALFVYVCVYCLCLQSLIEIAVPLDEERASPSRPKHAPPSASLLSIQHDPSLVNELEAYRQTFHRHTQACEATRIKTALPEWQIVSMCVHNAG